MKAKGPELATSLVCSQARSPCLPSLHLPPSLLLPMWGYREKVHVYKLESGPPPPSLVLWFQTSQLPELWETDVCCLSHLVYGILLRRPELPETHQVLTHGQCGGTCPCLSIALPRNFSPVMRFIWPSCRDVNSTWCSEIEVAREGLHTSEDPGLSAWAFSRDDMSLHSQLAG